MARGHASLADREARAAFVHTLRTIVDPGGQRVNANDRLYLAEEVPFLIIWGARDSIIPVAHGDAVHERCRRAASRSSRTRATSRSVDEPQRFIEVLTEFIDDTEPADLDADEWGDLLRAGAPAAAAPGR